LDLLSQTAKLNGVDVSLHRLEGVLKDHLKNAKTISNKILDFCTMYTWIKMRRQVS
jgi:hypothetical protein